MVSSDQARVNHLFTCPSVGSLFQLITFKHASLLTYFISFVTCHPSRARSQLHLYSMKHTLSMAFTILVLADLLSTIRPCVCTCLLIYYPSTRRRTFHQKAMCRYLVRSFDHPSTHRRTFYHQTMCACLVRSFYHLSTHRNAFYHHTIWTCLFRSSYLLSTLLCTGFY